MIKLKAIIIHSISSSLIKGWIQLRRIAIRIRSKSRKSQLKETTRHPFWIVFNQRKMMVKISLVSSCEAKVKKEQASYIAILPQ